MSASATRAADTTSASPPLEKVFDSEPVEGELPVTAVDGEIPRGLAGTYFLSGPARFGAGATRYANWLDGDGMVVAATFPGGGEAPVVRQRFVQTAKLVAERAEGRALYRTFGTRFEGDRLVHGVTVASPVNLSTWPFAGRLLAFGEQGQPWEIERDTLATRGPATFGGAVTAATPFSGHPKVDPHTGELVTFGVSFAGKAPQLHYFRFGADGALALRARQPLPYPASIHDFALAARHAAFHVAPHLLDLGKLRAGSTVLEALSWRPELGTRLVVLDRATGATVADLPVGDRYCLHLLNAFERPSTPSLQLTKEGDRGVLVVDLVELDRPIYEDYHHLPDLFVDSPGGRAVRYEVDLQSGELAARRTGEELGTVDFPTLDRRRATRENPEGWLLQISATTQHPKSAERKFFDRLLHVSWESGRILSAWRTPIDTWLAGEPAFAPGADAPSLVVPLWDSAANVGALALFDPFAVERGPRATVRLGARAPLGFHSFWDATP
jgi:carotenoid cleavage dioxygenase-like enzyme